jgi:glycosyltransferase 2 family protein
LAGVFERPVHWRFFALACLFELASVLLTFARWYYLVRAQGLPFTLTSALRLGMIGFYLSTFLPGAVGGDIIKAAFIAREQSRRTIAVATVIIDRVIGLCGLIWLTALAGGFFWLTGLLTTIATEPAAILVLESIFGMAAGLMAGSIVFWVLLGCLSQPRADALTRWLKKLPKIGGPLAEFWRAGWLYRCRSGAVAWAMILAMVGHLGFVLVFYLSARTLNDSATMPSLQAHFLAVPVGMTISAGIPTPGNVGGGEFVYGKLYELLGYAVAAGVLGSLMKRCIDWVLGLVGYVIYLRMKPGLRAASASMVEEEENSPVLSRQL